MQSLEIAGTDYMRTRGAARAGAAPRVLDQAASPTLNVGATQYKTSLASSTDLQKDVNLLV